MGRCWTILFILLLIILMIYFAYSKEFKILCFAATVAFVFVFIMYKQKEQIYADPYFKDGEENATQIKDDIPLSLFDVKDIWLDHKREIQETKVSKPKIV